MDSHCQAIIDLVSETPREPKKCVHCKNRLERAHCDSQLPKGNLNAAVSNSVATGILGPQRQCDVVVRGVFFAGGGF